ncbi:hypothetical protein LTR64_000844 [Lithohypha guttulata]|uniref:uncharacterized protein n=1 Tax=Lithohypha guttulata TaxID=1690604 RepID=UPI002DE0E186|nr:hypothetical protein LTR51_005390 [Lithohypha guttulata]
MSGGRVTDSPATQQNEGLTGHIFAPVNVSGNGTLQQGDIYHYSIAAATQNSLFKAVDYDSFGNREGQVKSATAHTCEWIWSTIFGTWISDLHAQIFWVSGKPGSGKSTLIKHLSTSSKTKTVLPDTDGGWAVATFFFDFREGNKIANSIEGLLKGVIKQVAEATSSEDPRLNSNEKLLNLDLQQLLHDLLSHAKQNFFILLDGLDEYGDELSELCTLILSLGEHQNIKLCVASRREPAINRRFGQLPNLHMSDYNSSGILSYVNVEIQKLRQSLTECQPFDLEALQRILCERAEGVFLWVYLALREVRYAIDRSRTAQEVMSILEELPLELEKLYQRIVDRMAGAQKKEAAVLYTLLEDTKVHPVTTQILFGAYQFLAHEIGLEGFPKDIVDLQHFERIFDGTLGGMFELCKSSKPAPGGDTSVIPRIMHETVRRFSRDSRWNQEWQPNVFKHHFPNLVWSRLGCYALIAADKRLQKVRLNDLRATFTSITNTGRSSSGLAGCLDYAEFARLLSRHLPHDSLMHWFRLLHLSMDTIFPYAEQIIHQADDDLKLRLQKAMRSQWTNLRLASWQHDTTARVNPGELVHCGFADLLQAAAHHCYSYLLWERSSMSMLSDIERAAVCCAILFGYRLSPLKWPNFTSQRDDDDLKRDTINEILCHDRRLSVLHLAVYLYLGYKNVPKFLRKHQKTGRITNWAIVNPLWPQDTYLFVATPETPLFMWVCARHTPGESGYDRREQLKVLLQFSVDIHAKSTRGMNIVHYLITEHLIRHTFLEQDMTCWPDDDTAITIEQLYWLEEAGADFTSRYNNQTLLEALRTGFYQMKPIDDDTLLYPRTDVVNTRFAQIKFMLQHMESKGHLPQPMMGTNARFISNFPALQRYIRTKRCDLCSATADTRKVHRKIRSSRGRSSALRSVEIAPPGNWI